jgi:hypothetical protein
MLQIRSEDRRKIPITGECQIIVLYFLLNVDFERRECSAEYNGILAVHILYVLY